MTRRDAWGESALYKEGSYTCSTLLAFFMPYHALEAIDVSLKGIDPRAIAIALSVGRTLRYPSQFSQIQRRLSGPAPRVSLPPSPDPEYSSSFQEDFAKK